MVLNNCNSIFQAEIIADIFSIEYQVRLFQLVNIIYEYKAS